MNENTLQPIKLRYGIVGNASGLNHALDVAIQVAPTSLSVLIQGENGVGKEVIPRLIHDNSPRKHRKYFAINCGSIPEGTIDSELFGHEKGSFTGALNEHEGYFGAADGGTLFLDEVGELPLSTQVRLLRVLETGEYLRVGSNQVRKTDVRIVAATNVQVKNAIKQGHFREDLYYRLAAIPIIVPPLRERGDDVLLLFRKFAADIAEKYRLDPIRLTDDAKPLMRSYKWPGNIRQLRNLTEQLSILAPSRDIDAATLQQFGLTDDDAATGGLVLARDPHTPHSYESEREMLLRQLFSLSQEVKEIKQLMHEQLRATSTTGAPTQNPPAFASFTPLNEVPTDYATVEAIDDAPLSIRELTEQTIREALQRNNNNRKKAALELGISERSIYRKIREFGIDTGGYTRPSRVGLTPG